MSEPYVTRTEFESFLDAEYTPFRDGILGNVREVMTLVRTDDAEASTAKGNARLIQALRDTQIEHGRVLERHDTMLRELAGTVAGLVVGQEELKTDVAELKTDVATLKTDVAELKGDVAELKGDVAELKGDVAELKGDVVGLKGGLARVLQILDERLPPPAR